MEATMNLFLILSFLVGFLMAALLFCLLFKSIVDYTTTGWKEQQKEEQWKFNGEILKLWQESNRLSSLQTDALTVIAKCFQESDNKE
jgi:hypothetical protein